MAVYFFDASAVVKYYHKEVGTAWVSQVIDALDTITRRRINRVYIADLSIAEVPAAFAILERTKRVHHDKRDAMYDRFLNNIGNEFQLLGIPTELAYRAGELTQEHPLKGGDAIQLAVALDFNAKLQEQDLALIFVSGDAVLLQAARAEGLAAENPFAHAVEGGQ